jgi:serine/threonine protein kinase
VAVKELLSRKFDEWDISCFIREVRALSALTHPYLVEFIGATSNGPFWIVTEFVPGRSLFARLRETPSLDGRARTVVAYEIAKALAYLHSQNMIHLDMKTQNVLLDALPITAFT